MAISNYTATTTSGTAVNASDARDQLVITNTGANGVFLNIDGVAEVSKGIYLAPNGGVWSFSTVCGAGSATINIRNHTTASITEGTPLRFTIIKGVTA